MEGLRRVKGGFAFLFAVHPATRGIGKTALQVGEGGGVDLFLLTASKGEGGGADNGDGNPFRAFGHNGRLSAKGRRSGGLCHNVVRFEA